MILEPEHETEEPSAVKSLTPEVEEEAGAGNTETEASELTKKKVGRKLVLKVNQRRACGTGRQGKCIHLMAY